MCITGRRAAWRSRSDPRRADLPGVLPVPRSLVVERVATAVEVRAREVLGQRHAEEAALAQARRRPAPRRRRPGAVPPARRDAHVLPG